MRKQQIYDKEKVTFNLVKYEKFGKKFELVVEPDLAIKYKKTSEKNDEEITELVKAENIFSDAKKGVIAKEEDLQEVFRTQNFNEIAHKMLMEGEIQLTSEYREKLREEKKRKIVNTIHRTTINPQTGTPHPIVRIENALAEAKVHIDEFKKAEDQVKTVLDALKPIIPIKKDDSLLEIILSMKHASALRGILTNYGTLQKEDWRGDGSYRCLLELPSGLKQDLMDELNNKTKGEVNITLLKGETK